jgi:hypothetical protein
MGFAPLVLIQSGEHSRAEPTSGGRQVAFARMRVCSLLATAAPDFGDARRTRAV